MGKEHFKNYVSKIGKGMFLKYFANSVEGFKHFLDAVSAKQTVEQWSHFFLNRISNNNQCFSKICKQFFAFNVFEYNVRIFSGINIKK